MTTFTVTTNADSGAGSLRQALADAEANGTGADSIVFDASLAGQVIDLTSGALSIVTGAVSINGDTDGDGDADITIERSEANVATSILVDTAAGTVVNLNSLVLRNADTGTITSHAGLVNRGTMVITDSLITGQKTTGTDTARRDVNGLGDPGGAALSGIDNSGSLTLRETVLENMSATGGIGGYNESGSGGTGGQGTSGILNQAGGSLLVDNVLFKNLTATGGKGGNGSLGGHGGDGNVGWQTAGTITGDAGHTGLTATGGAAGFFELFPVIVGTVGSGFTPSTSGGFTLISMAGATQGANILVGDGLANTIYGLNGDDTISGDAGTDTLYGGSGTDTLNGGDDGDTLYGWTGGDTLNGDAGDDTLNGQAGRDTLNGGSGIDALRGQSDNDTLYGGDDADKLYGGTGNDSLYGDAAADYLVGSNGQDSLTGGGGNDRLIGGADADQFRFTANGFGHDLILDFVDDVDTLVIDLSVYSDTNPELNSVQGILDTFGSLSAGGKRYSLDFGNGDVIELKVGVGFTATQLLDDISLIS